MIASDEGLAAIERSWLDGLKPDPLLTVSEWADQHRVLSQRASSEPGRWRTARTPYLKEIMDCLSPSSPIQRVAVMKGAQVGGTEAGNCWIGYVVHQAPGPMLAVSPTVELAKPQRQRKSDIHHHRELDDFGRCLEVAKRRSGHEVTLPGWCSALKPGSFDSAGLAPFTLAEDLQSRAV